MKTLTVTATLTSAVYAATIGEINGVAWKSPYNGQTLSNITGLVTAKGPAGFWIQSAVPDNDPRTSEGIYVFTSNTKSWVWGNVTVGDSVSIDGTVSDYRSADSSYVFLTEIASPKNLQVISKNNTITPLWLGRQRSPPTEQFSSLDHGDVFGTPNNVTQLTVANPTLQPTKYGMDFWKSITGEYVKVTGCVANGKLSKYGEVWIYCDWKVTGKNKRGGLTMLPGKYGKGADANPEGLQVGSPLDGTKNPDVHIGDQFADFEGVITQQFGANYILPLTKLNITKAQTTFAEPTKLQSDGRCFLTVGDYNIENFSPKDTKHISDVANHIAKYMLSPDLVFVQEVQDNDGPTDDGVVDSNLTLDALAAAIVAAGGKQYNYTYINPVDKQDGGQPGGNIRQAYLYNPLIVQLNESNPGGPLDANEVIQTFAGPKLKYNPGRIDPTNNVTWAASRKPLVAEWKILGAPKYSKPLFTINVHFTSKGGSSSITGDLRPPVNLGVDQRLLQAKATADFAKQILAKDHNAKIIVAGDMNEFSEVSPIKAFHGVLKEMEDVVDMPLNERYTYTFGQDMEQLDHMLVSRSLESRAKFDHIHVNTWQTYKLQVSDHDPSVARLYVC